MKELMKSYSSLLKAVLFVLFGVIAVFIDIDQSITHWTWPVFIFLAVALIGLEAYHHRQDKVSPLVKIKKYLLDVDGWGKSGSSNYYIANVEFIISPIEEEVPHLDYRQEWTRGEIGYHSETGNHAYQMGAFKSGLLLKKIHIVIFDGGKKIAVAPDWVAIGKGRFYFYTKNSVDYAYQQYLTHERGIDHSCGLRRTDTRGAFDIPVLNCLNELQKFTDYCDEPAMSPTTQEGEQADIFYYLLDKFNTFKQQRPS
ncbi:hypothetical protein [Cobetia amphilecti]|uniref:hypothetical protein n=1 Tax=Cobetia amphilecti TaxID=1055104 RepID=UPI00254A894C|nr:hypothetical protein [Cobetia amphilecti]